VLQPPQLLHAEQRVHILHSQYCKLLLLRNLRRKF
jgi:hypothetical protein